MNAQRNLMLALLVLLTIVVILGLRRQSILDESPVKHASVVLSAIHAGVPPAAAATHVLAKLAPEDMVPPTTKLATWTAAVGTKLLAAGLPEAATQTVTQSIMDHATVHNQTKLAASAAAAATATKTAVATASTVAATAKTLGLQVPGAK